MIERQARLLGPEHSRPADISLCVFPNIDEAVIVDAREGVAMGPRLQVLSAEDLFSEEFYSGLEKGFGEAIRGNSRPILSLMSMPQRVEDLLREHVVRAVFRALDGAEADWEPAHEEMAESDMPSMAVLFFTGSLVDTQDGHLREAVNSLFGQRLEGTTLDDCVDVVVDLACRERDECKGARNSELWALIQGDETEYATIWKSGD